MLAHGEIATKVHWDGPVEVGSLEADSTPQKRSTMDPSASVAGDSVSVVRVATYPTDYGGT